MNTTVKSFPTAKHLIKHDDECQQHRNWILSHDITLLHCS
jgi:hypothetical protein